MGFALLVCVIGLVSAFVVWLVEKPRGHGFETAAEDGMQQPSDRDADTRGETSDTEAEAISQLKERIVELWTAKTDDSVATMFWRIGNQLESFDTKKKLVFLFAANNEENASVINAMEKRIVGNLSIIVNNAISHADGDVSIYDEESANTLLDINDELIWTLEGLVKSLIQRRVCEALEESGKIKSYVDKMTAELKSYER